MDSDSKKMVILKVSNGSIDAYKKDDEIQRSTTNFSPVNWTG